MAEGSEVDAPTPAGPAAETVTKAAAAVRRQAFSGEPFTTRGPRNRGGKGVSKWAKPPYAPKPSPVVDPTDAATETPMGLSLDPVPAEPAPDPIPAPLPMTAQPFAPTMDQWAQLMALIGSNKLADQELAADIHARAMKKALRPENEVAPMISVYNPKGETLYPRPKPTHIYMMGPYPIADPGNYDTVTWTELELLNALRPGDYIVTKADGLDVKVTIRTEYESNGTKPYKTTMFMPIADDEQNKNWPPLVQLLTQITTGEAPMQSYTRYQRLLAEKDAEIAALQAQLAGKVA